MTTKLASFFTRDNPRHVVCLKDDAPEWLRDAVYATCDGATDWVYEECEAACSAIDDGSLTDDDGLHEHADGQVDIYTQKLAQWYADTCLSGVYSAAEQEAEDMGTEGSLDVNRTLMTIQYCAIRSIAAAMLRAWQENAEEESEAS
jgi:hypothetical protein